MLISEQRLDLWSRHQLLQKAAHDQVIEEPLAVLGKGKGGGVPDRIVGAQADKSAVQQVPAAADPEAGGSGPCSAQSQHSHGIQEIFKICKLPIPPALFINN